MTARGRYYRCDACALTPARCPSCRARRATARRAQGAERVLDGRCIECRAEALQGESRCEQHATANAARVAAHRARAAR